MKKLTSVKLTVGATTLLLAGLTTVQADIPQSAALAALPGTLAEEIPRLQNDWGNNPEIVSMVKQHNAKNTSLSSIQALDEQWRATSGLANFMLPYFDNPGVTALLNLEEEASYVLESFVMGNQGGVVSATNKTSDYWQGDEAKFTESYASGKGQVHIGEIEFDDSAQAYLVQISVPVMSDGAAIGAITIGVNVDDFE